jgi:hypothetical protein
MSGFINHRSWIGRFIVSSVRSRLTDHICFIKRILKEDGQMEYWYNYMCNLGSVYICSPCTRTLSLVFLQGPWWRVRPSSRASNEPSRWAKSDTGHPQVCWHIRNFIDFLTFLLRGCDIALRLKVDACKLVRNEEAADMNICSLCSAWFVQWHL